MSNDHNRSLRVDTQATNLSPSKIPDESSNRKGGGLDSAKG